ncbi:MAG: recombinase family protein [Oscillospiraceae bacterium]|nr:recombinase family protein [Oscillospiraceae bacterium]
MNDLIIDEDAAVNVRRIFQLVIDGKGVYQIANILTADKVLIPSAQLPFRRVRTAFL